MCVFKGCRVPAESGSDLCIFHLACPKDVERFKEVLYRQIDETGSEETRNNRFDFRDYRFPVGIKIGSLPARKATSDVILPVVMDNSHFTRAKIEGHVSFDSACLLGGADFRLANIEGNARFSFSHILGGRANFSRATIRGSANFSGAEIKGHAEFRETMIGGEASFYSATIEGRANFRDAAIRGDASFNSVVVKGDGFFNSAIFQGNTEFIGATVTGVADFSKAAMRGAVDFRGCSAGSVFLGAGAPMIRGWLMCKERCGVTLCDDLTASSFWEFAQRIFSKMDERELADTAFYFKRVWHWKALRKVESGRGVRLKRSRTSLLRIGYWVLWALDCLLLRWTTAYGSSVSRLFATWFAVICGFGIAFSLRPSLIQGPSGEGPLWDWVRGFHYSTTTFATLGLGNVGPGSSRLGMLLTSIEALLGAILIALAVLVIGRRFMR